MNQITSRFSKLRSFLCVFISAMAVATMVSAQTAPSPYVGRLSPKALNAIAGASFRAHETYNLSELLSSKTAQPLATKAVQAANSIAVSSSVQTIDYLTDLAPGATAPTNTPTNIDPVYSPSESYIVFASNGVFTPATTTGTTSTLATFNAGSTFHLWAIQASDSATLSGTSSVPPASLVQLSNGKTSAGNPANERWPFVISATQIVFCQQQASGFYHVILATISNSGGVLSVTGETDVTANLSTDLDCEHPTFSGGFIAFAGRVSTSAPYHIYEYDLADESLTQLTKGSNDDENPSFSLVGGLIAFDSNASSFSGGNSGVALVGSGTGARNIYVSSVSGSTSPVKFTNTSGAINSIEPAWGFVPTSTPINGFDSQILPQGQKIFFSSNRVGGHYNIYWLYATVQSNGNVPAENSSFVNVLNGPNVTNTATALRTSDPLGAGQPVGAADNLEPAAPGFNFYYTVIYTSPRFIQNLPADNPIDNGTNPPALSPDREAATYATSPLGAFSPVGTEQSSTGGFEILGSKLLDIDPPALLSYSPDEIIHTQLDSNLPGSTVSSRFVAAGTKIHFVVRLSQRQSGIGQVYLQIKDPNSKYQDGASLEHKVFTQDPYVTAPYVPDGSGTTQVGNFLYTQRNEATILAQLASNSGAGGLAIAGNATLDGGFEPIMPGHILTSAFRPLSAITVQHPATYPMAGFTGQAELSSTNGQISTTMAISDVQNLDDSGFNGVEPANHMAGDILAVYDSGGNFLQYSQIISANYSFLGADPITANCVVSSYEVPKQPTGASHAGYAVVVATSRLDFFGNEIDCQAILAGTGSQANASLISSFITPPWVPGFDDAVPQSGVGLAPTDSGYSAGANGAVPSDDAWLPLKPVPSSSPLYDTAGGVLYEASWQTPTVPSDYYVDVVAYDNETPAQNWRIYDNVWGFTTKVFQTTTSPGGILVVNDYDLPQKFFSGRFGNITLKNVGNPNTSILPLNYFGSESYLTDIDVNYTDATYGNTPPPAWLPDSAMTTDEDNTASGTTFQHGRMSSFFHVPTGGAQFTGGGYTYTPFYANTLGVNSYIDPDQSNINADADSEPAFPVTESIDVSYSNAPSEAQSQHYDIWRILSRGSVPQSVLSAYAPQINTQPLDPINGNVGNTVATSKNVLVANSCVIWSSPVAGDEFVGAGTITDPNTLAELTSFVNSGGRLFVEGQDVGFALTSNSGNASSFYTKILDAQFGSDSEPQSDSTYILKGGVGQTHYISDDSYINNDAGEAGVLNYPAQTGAVLHTNFKTDNPAVLVGTVPDWTYGPPAAGLLTLAEDDRGTIGSSNSRTDGALNDSGTQETALTTFNFIDGFTGLGVSAPANGPVIGSFQSTELAGTNAAPDNQLIYTTFPSPTGVDYGGAVTAYASFGIESLSQESHIIQRNDGPIKLPDEFEVLNQRTDVMQNIICFLRTGTINGVVTNTDGGARVANATVVATYVKTNGFAAPATLSYTALTDSGGNYSIVGVPAGRYNVAAYFPGTTFQHAAGSTVNVLGGDIGTIGLQVAPAAPGSIQVTVEDAASGAVLQGASVTVTEQTTKASIGTETTNASGTATYSNVPPAVYLVTASDLPTYGVSQAAAVTVMSGVQATITIKLTLAPGLIGGDVTANGVGVGTAIVTATNSVTGVVLPFAGCDSNGNYTIYSVPPGTYSVAVAASPYTPQTATTTVVTNQLSVVNFSLTITPVVSGTVTDISTGNPISGATVTISPSVGSTTSVTTGSTGTYTFNGVTIQPYTLTASATGYNTASATVTPLTTGPTTQNFALSATLQTGFTAGNLSLISLPYDYSKDSFSLAQIFGYTSPKTAVWDPLNLIYDVTPTPPADTVLPGIGYWIRFPAGANPVITAGASVSTPFTIQVQTGWNQIGDPFTTKVPISSLKFTRAGGVQQSFAAAVSNGVVSNVIWSYNPATNQYVAHTSTDSVDPNVDPYQGYWLQVFAPQALEFDLP